MYNSRSRRTGYDRYPESFAVPENYSGNAFRGGVADDIELNADSETAESLSENSAENIEEAFESADQEEIESVETMAKGDSKLHFSKKPFASKLGFGFNASRLFGSSFGVEELLLIGLILLISQSENNEDVIALLVLLLFIG